MAKPGQFHGKCNYRFNSSLTNSTQFGNDSKFNGENIATNCSTVIVLALDGLTKKHFGHYALLKIFPSDHQVALKDLYIRSEFLERNLCEAFC